MSVPESIKQLVERFGANRGAYRSSKYNETQARREFIDPFFKALGWDIDNEQSYAEAYKDVIHEPTLEVEGETKAPDYAFRISAGRASSSLKSRNRRSTSTATFILPFSCADMPGRLNCLCPS